ncbi:MAG: hypothetical protein A2Z31_04995 [candidate division NC10 bacterium RBG_16_65_8]|nr:MAG: hypothetical protein A2Z31_04995 [candidate division NC10 bacterium RBG_16_65_8]
MSPKRTAEPTTDGPGMVRTTVVLPEGLWKAAKIRALEDGDLRTVIIKALEAYLAGLRKKGGR